MEGEKEERRESWRKGDKTGKEGSAGRKEDGMEERWRVERGEMREDREEREKK